MAARKKVLIIDDEPMVLDTYKAFLEENDIEVDVCESGNDAPDYVAKHDYDLIICDMLMPGKSGLNTVNAIVRVKPESKVLVVTGYSETGYVKKHPNVVDVLSKACHLKEILVYI